MVAVLEPMRQPCQPSQRIAWRIGSRRRLVALGLLSLLGRIPLRLRSITHVEPKRYIVMQDLVA